MGDNYAVLVADPDAPEVSTPILGFSGGWLLIGPKPGGERLRMVEVNEAIYRGVRFTIPAVPWFRDLLDGQPAENEPTHSH